MTPPRDIRPTWRQPAANRDEPEAASAVALQRYRAIFISDFHLGTPGCQAAALLEFLRVTESDYLYLVGDIVDGWQLRRRWYWHQLHNDVIQKVLRKVRKGTQVVYIPGNHDEAARHYVGVDFGGVAIRQEADHVTSTGLRLLVTHGDRFDAVVTCARWLALLGDRLYTFILKLNQHFNAARARLGLPYWSLSQFLKYKVKNAISYITAFEDAVAREARTRGYDGVVCGHIHHAEIRRIDDVVYCNSGDWVESLTALVESGDGTLSILRWQDVLSAAANAPAAQVPAASPVVTQA
ncbi:MAG TPA: UDP-2,3-diacylglucosamine diphosphatase [Casimicrobiaceae bacterium]|nr:UDP-2,3-diacylglucosamine diphosphatase [Casimicrobiaceae bacterium]